MRIVLYTMYFRPDFGSAPVLMAELAAHLAASGHEVEVVTTLPRRRGPEFCGLALSVRREDGCLVKRLWTTTGASPLGRFIAWNLYAVGALVNVLTTKRGALHLLRTPPLQLGLAALAAKALKRARVLVNVQDIHPDLAMEAGILRNPVGVRLARALERAVYRLSDRIAVISDGFKANLLAKGVPGGKIAVLPNWVDTEVLRPLPRDNPVAKRLGLDGIFVVMYSGTISISSDSALEQVLEASALLGSGPEVRFVLVGEGLRKEALMAKASALGTRNVVFLPFQPFADLPALLASADVLLVPLDAEKSGLSIPSKLYTAMAAGRPILALASPTSEMAALVRESGCGLVVPPEARAVAEAVRALYGSPETRRSLGERARAEAVRRYAKSKVLGDYETLLRSMAS